MVAWTPPFTNSIAKALYLPTPVIATDIEARVVAITIPCSTSVELPVGFEPTTY